MTFPVYIREYEFSYQINFTSDYEDLKIGVYFFVAFSVISKSSFISFFIPSNADFCMATISIVCSILLWKSNLERLINGSGNASAIDFERQCLAVCYRCKQKIG